MIKLSSIVVALGLILCISSIYLLSLMLYAPESFVSHHVHSIINTPPPTLTVNTTLTVNKSIPHRFIRIYGIWDRNDSIEAYVQRWRPLYPQWDHDSYAFDGVRARRMVSTYYAQYDDVLRAMSPIQQSDMLRYILLYHYGGVYVDVDVIPSRAHSSTLDQLTTTAATAIVFEEMRVTKQQAQAMASKPIRHGVPEAMIRIANYVMMCEPRHRLLRMIIEEVMVRMNTTSTISTDDDDEYNVLYTTGPDVISTIIDRLNASTRHALGIQVITDASPFLCHITRGSWKRSWLWRNPNCPRVI